MELVARDNALHRPDMGRQRLRRAVGRVVLLVRLKQKSGNDSSTDVQQCSVPQNLFIGRYAEGYDYASGDMNDAELVDATADFLADEAAGGAALEFGIGTGRVALPLSRRGVPVHGIDISEDM